MEIPLDFSVLTKSGLRQKNELQQLFGASRLTVHGYVHGKGKPRGDNAARAAVVLKVLQALVEKGKLPLAATKTAEQRKEAVDKILAVVNDTLAKLQATEKQ